MKYRFISSICIALALSPLTVQAENENSTKDAFVFSLDGSKEVAYKFEQYNILSFTQNAYVLSSSNPNLSPITFPYNEYNRVVFGSSANVNGVEDIDVTNSYLCYDSATSIVSVAGEDSSSYQVGVFSLFGMLLASDYGQVNVSELPSGVYVAIAIDGTTKHTIKFKK